MTDSYFFTFSLDSTFHSLYVEIEIEALDGQKWVNWSRKDATRQIARDLIRRHFGTRWVFCYSAEQFAHHVEERPYKRLCKIIDNWPERSYTETK